MQESTHPEAPVAPELGGPAPGEQPLVPGGDEAQRARRARQARLLVIGVVLAAAVALLWPQRSDQRNRPGGFLVDAQGRPSPLAEHLTPVTLVHFWATWCPPCVEEVPSLQRLAGELASEGAFSVAMIAVADDPRQVAAFFGGDDRHVLYDPQWEVANRFGTEALPETHLIVDGEVAETFVGATDWTDPAVRERLAQALATARPGPLQGGAG